MRSVALTLLMLAGAAACAPQWKQAPHDRMYQREREVLLERAPARRAPSEWWDRGFQLAIRPLGRAISPGRWIADAMGGRAARDVNDLGQVPDSGWFENRISRRALSVDDAFRGATRTDGPASGPLFVIGGKLDGASPGFVVRDRDQVVWYLKLDPPASPELSTSAEVIASRLMWIAGYHVPEIHVLDVETERLVLDPSARTRDRYGRSIPLTGAALARLLSPLNTDRAGRVRVLVSRQPDGVVLGPYSYRGRVASDRNDRIDHEHRRSLRALWVFAAWVNNTDIRNQNSLDVYRPLTPAGRGVVRHYLLDLGDSLGATGTGEKAASGGFEYLFDWRAVLSNLVMLGMRYPDHDRVRRSAFRSVGLFEASVFSPTTWRPRYPNPAFEECTRADTLWAASILARIQPDHVRAAVAAGRYHEEGATTHVVQTLLERRRKLLVHALAGFLEIDQPRMRGSVLVMDDLRAVGGLPSAGPITYSARWNRTRRADRALAKGSVSTTSRTPATIHDTGEPALAHASVLGEVQLDLSAALAAARRHAGFEEDPFITVELSRAHVRAAIHVRVVGDELLVVALER